MPGLARYFHLISLSSVALRCDSCAGLAAVRSRAQETRLLQHQLADDLAPQHLAHRAAIDHPLALRRLVADDLCGERLEFFALVECRHVRERDGENEIGLR